MQLQQIDVLQHLEQLKSYYDKKPSAKTAKAVSALLQIPEPFLALFYDTLGKIDLMHLTRTPSGRLKQMELNPNSTVICFAPKDRDSVLFGYICQGKRIDWRTELDGTLYFPGSAFLNKQLCSTRLQFFKDRADELALPCVVNALSAQQFAEIMCVQMRKVANLDVVDQKGQPIPLPTKKEIVKPPDPLAAFSDYPLVREKVAAIHKQIAVLEKEIADEAEQNKKNGQWYETEYAKARNGTRTVRKSHSFVVGYETKETTTTSSMGAWYSDTPHEDVRSRQEPIYETRYWTAPDFPDRPEKIEVKKCQNPAKIAECNALIAKYQREMAACEQTLHAALKKTEERQQLERARHEINLKLRNL